MLEAARPVTSLKSHLLIAAPELAEPFTRSVVLLVQHTSEGALGLILNRPTEDDFDETWNKVSDVPCRRKGPIFLGGPCPGLFGALHTNEFLLELEVMPGLYFSAGKEKLETLAAQSEEETPHVKFFNGYSGWAAGQLEHEIRRGSWSVMPATAEHVFAHEDELWTRATRFVADAAWRTRLGIKHKPPDLRLN